MARTLCPDVPRLSIMVAATRCVLACAVRLGPGGVIIAAALIGLAAFRPQPGTAHEPLPISIRRRTGLLWLTLFCALLLGLPLLASLFPSPLLAMVDAFYWPWLAGLRWRACGAATAAGRGGANRLG